ncbi:MAG: ABC transporter ATP-binding protein [Thermoleophilaceae bacterium]
MPAKGAMDRTVEAPASEPLSSERTTAVELRAVTRRFGDIIALSDLTLSVRQGEVVALVGPSGCGKSTLLELVAGLQEPDDGSVGAVPAALMPQRDLLLPWRSALANAALALECAGVRAAEARSRARPLFERFGLGGFEDARSWELSGGMRQRVALVRTFLSGRPLLLLDEPFASLDAITRAALQEWLGDALRAEPRTVVLVTHDVQEAIYLADRVAVLSQRPGRIVAEIAVDLRRPRPRRQTITSPHFIALEERALKALER